MLVLMSVSMSFMRGLVWPPATISKPCTIGTPAAIIVASWRLKTAMSRRLDRLAGLAEERLGLGFDDLRIDALLAQLGLDQARVLG